ncbi:hypothetical protein ES703_44769 [subsurface metagenome]
MLVGTSGTGSAFALSTDNGTTFTGIGLNVAGTDVSDFALAGDNTTVYATDKESDKLYKSINAGVSWTELTNPSGVTEPQLVAVAPDDPDIVAVIADNNELYLSTNGGTTFGAVSPDIGGAAMTVINDVAISPAVGATHYIAAVGTDSGGEEEVAYFNLGGSVPKWTSAFDNAAWSSTSFGITGQVRAVAFSPAFASDKVMVVVGEDGTDTLFGIASFSLKKWNVSAGFAGYPVTVQAGTGALLSASISLSPTYYGADGTRRKAFVGITDSAGTGGGLYRLNNYLKTTLKPATAIHSVAYDGTNLVAGSWDTNDVYRCANPLAKTVTLYRTSVYQRPGGTSKVVAAWAGDKVVAGTSGASSAFAVSRDNGKTFNDISLIDTALTNINDVAVSADGSKVYMVTDDGVNLSLWRKTSAWERVLNLFDTGYIIRLAPEDASHAYLVNTLSTTMYYSNDSGETRWGRRACTTTPVDAAVESADVIYVLNSTGLVYKSTNAGFTWGPPRSTGLGNGATIVSLSEDNLLVGGSAGGLAYSTDGSASSTTWTAKTGVFSTSNVQVAASGLADGDYIYAATSTANQTIKRWKVGSPLPWSSISATLDGSCYGLVLSDGILYAVTSDSMDSYMYRTLHPTKATSSVFWSYVTSAGEVFNKTPQALKVSSGSKKLWAINNATTDRLYTFTDTMCDVGPALVSPSEGFQNPVNPVTGRAWDVAFSWSRLSKSTEYRLEIARDTAFKEKVLVHNTYSSAPTVAVMAGPYQYPYIEYMAGATYYWRVKATLPIYSPWSEVRSFSVESLGPVPDVRVSINALSWVPEGYDFTVPVDIIGVTNFDAASYDVSFNSTVLRLDNVTSGQIDGTTIPVVAWSENVTGTATIVQNLEGTPGVSGSGQLAVLHFNAIGSLGDSSNIELSSGVLSSNLAEEISAVWVDDSVYVSFFLMGDANGDGKVNAVDITKVERIIAGLD